GRIEMTPGYTPDGIDHRENGQAECQGNAKQSDADARNASGKDCTATAAEYQPERTNELGSEFLHGDPSSNDRLRAGLYACLAGARSMRGRRLRRRGGYADALRGRK